MINNENDVTINDDDIEYFNSHFQKTDELFDGIDDLISNIEAERANALLTTFSFISNIENTKTSIDSLYDEMTEVINMSKIMKDPHKSSFSPIIKYCSTNNSLYSNFKLMYEAESKLNELKNSQLDINSAIDYMNNVFNSTDPFNLWAHSEFITPEKFCNYLTIMKTFLERTKSDNRINLVEGLLETFKTKLLNSFKDDTINFAPFTLCGAFLVDQSNSQLFDQYFKIFTSRYFNFLCNQNFNFNIKKKRLSEIIQKLMSFINSQLNQYHLYHFSSNVENSYDRILNAIRENLIPLLTGIFNKANQIEYQSFEGTSFNDLIQFETKQLINSSVKIIDDVELDNLKELLKILKNINDVKDSIKDRLQNKFEKLKKSIKIPNGYKQLAELSDIIDKFNESGGYSFDNYNDEILKYAEREGEIRMPFKNNFAEIIDNQDPVIDKIVNEMKKFISDFAISGDATKNFMTEITEKKYKYIFQYTHGFLKSFYKYWKKSFSSINDDIVESCLKYVYWLYTAMKLYQSSDEIDKMYAPIDNFKPRNYKNEKDIYSSFDAINQNIQNTSISALKKECYQDLQNIINTLPEEKIKANWHD